MPGEKLCRKAEVVDAKKPLEEKNIAEGGLLVSEGSLLERVDQQF